jgi:hypothetical protein
VSIGEIGHQSNNCFATSPTVKITTITPTFDFEAGNSVSLSPVPSYAGQPVFLNLNMVKQGRIDVILTDIAGKILNRQIVLGQIGEQMVSIYPPQLSGMYFVYLKYQDKWSKGYKLIVK